MTSNIAVHESHDGLENTTKKNFKPKDFCSNCGTQLSGKYCHSCGQPSRSIIKFFGQVIKDILEDLVGYDSRLKHTIFPLLFKPGQITIDYVNGKVFHYVLPTRLYLILSVVCILLVQAITDPKSIITEDINSDTVEQQQESVKQDLTDLKNELTDNNNDAIVIGRLLDEDTNNQKKLTQLDRGTNPDNESGELSPDNTSSQNTIKVSSDYLDFSYDANTDKMEFTGDFYNEYPYFKQAIIDIKNKSKSWKDDPTPLVKKIFELFPIMMFVILPLFALVLKFTYIFSKRYYIEHLVFCLHNHCFIYFALILEILLSLLDTVLVSHDNWFSWFFSELTDYITTALACWILVYIVIAMKRVYRQGWLMTLTKTIFLGAVYFLFLLFGLLITALVGAWQA